jgi:hypothetical protein
VCVFTKEEERPAASGLVKVKTSVAAVLEKINSGYQTNWNRQVFDSESFKEPQADGSLKFRGTTQHW